MADIRYNKKEHEWTDVRGNVHTFKALWYTKFVHSFMTNAITRWIGFNEYKTNNTFDAMFVDENEINVTHFNAAMHFMMQTDYVMTSSSFIDDELRTDNEIHTMYEFLNEHIYQHLDMEYIPQSKRDEYKMHSEFQDKTDKIGHPQRVIKHLTEKDYDALHEHNDYDMRL
eukprot:306825_1